MSSSYVNIIGWGRSVDVLDVREIERLMNQYVAQAEQNGFFLRDVKFSEMLVVLIFDKKEHGGFGGPGGWHGGHGGHGGGFGGPGGGHGGHGGGHGGGFGGPGGGHGGHGGGQEF
ncbi:hypothetical protein KVF10_03525 [Helicobacter pylori]|nr:hypothetical protein KVF10_03525 [Helicobacter pylori]